MIESFQQTLGLRDNDEGRDKNLKELVAECLELQAILQYNVSNLIKSLDETKEAITKDDHNNIKRRSGTKRQSKIASAG